MFSLIVAHDKNNLIGINNSLPWKIKKDLQYFKLITENKTVVMGRKCFDSIGKSLPNRENLVITRNKNFKKCNTISNIKDFVTNHIYTNKDIFIIGGSEIYEIFLPYCQYLYITYIDETFYGDNPVYFPKLNYENYKLLSEEKHFDNFKFYFRRYKCLKL